MKLDFHLCAHPSIPNKYRVCDSTTLEITDGQKHGLDFADARIITEIRTKQKLEFSE